MLVGLSDEYPFGMVCWESVRRVSASGQTGSQPSDPSIKVCIFFGSRHLAR